VEAPIFGAAGKGKASCPFGIGLGHYSNPKMIALNQMHRALQSEAINALVRLFSGNMSQGGGTTPAGGNPTALQATQGGVVFSKVFIQRDYSEGTSVKFHTRLPTELEGMVSVPSVSPGITINIYLHSRTD